MTSTTRQRTPATHRLDRGASGGSVIRRDTFRTPPRHGVALEDRPNSRIPEEAQRPSGKREPWAGPQPRMLAGWMVVSALASTSASSFGPGGLFSAVILLAVCIGVFALLDRAIGHRIVAVRDAWLASGPEGVVGHVEGERADCAAVSDSASVGGSGGEGGCSGS
jgi:hypothetical protein